jgi:hypothetical protein
MQISEHYEDSTAQYKIVDVDMEYEHENTVSLSLVNHVSWGNGNSNSNDFLPISVNFDVVELIRKPVVISKMLHNGTVIHVKSYVYTFSDDLVPSSIMDMSEHHSMTRLRQQLETVDMNWIPYTFENGDLTFTDPPKPDNNKDIEDLFIL